MLEITFSSQSPDLKEMEATEDGLNPYRSQGKISDTFSINFH